MMGKSLKGMEPRNQLSIMTTFFYYNHLCFPTLCQVFLEQTIDPPFLSSPHFSPPLPHPWTSYALCLPNQEGFIVLLHGYPKRIKDCREKMEEIPADASSLLPYSSL